MERGFLAMLGRCYPSRLANLEIRATDNDNIISILLLACIRWVHVYYTLAIPLLYHIKWSRSISSSLFSPRFK